VTGIVILNYNNVEDTISCINSIRKYTSQNLYKLIIVDNASNEDVYNNVGLFLKEIYRDNLKTYGENDAISETLSEVSYIRLNNNKGYARGNNYGLNLLYNDKSINYIMILNNDVLFVMDILPKLTNFLEKNKDAGIVSPILYKKIL